MDLLNHWEIIYKTKQEHEVSWYQQRPDTSLAIIEQFNISTSAKVIDIGGGDSLLVDYLIDLGHQDITVLDISESALERSKKRLGTLSKNVRWIAGDVLNFNPSEQYDIWHDRAAFHFLTRKSEIGSYIDTAQRIIRPGGLLILGTFSEQGPQKCSGLVIKQYSEAAMTQKFERFFKKVDCLTVDHKTPRGTLQNFIYCSFIKR